MVSPSNSGSSQPASRAVAETVRLREAAEAELAGDQRARLDEHQPGVAGLLEQPVERAVAELLGRGDHHGGARVDLLRRRTRRPSAPTCTSTPSSSSTLATAWAPSGPAVRRVEADVVLLAAVGRPDHERRPPARAPPTISSVRAVPPPAAAHRSTARSSSRARTSSACSRVAGRSPYSTESKSAAARVDPRPAVGVLAGQDAGHLVRGRAGGVVQAPALHLARRQRPEAVDQRVLVAAVGQRRLRAGAQLGGGDRLVGEHRLPVAAVPGRSRAPGGPATPERRPAAPRAPSPRTSAAAAGPTAASTPLSSCRRSQVISRSTRLSS